jgi:hypothetical protein
MEVKYEAAAFAFMGERVPTADNVATYSGLGTRPSPALESVLPDAGGGFRDLATDASRANDATASTREAFLTLQEEIAELTHIYGPGTHWQVLEDRRRYRLVDTLPKHFVEDLEIQFSSASSEIQAAVNYYCDALRRQTWFEYDEPFFIAATFQFTTSCAQPDAEFLFRRVGSAREEAVKSDLSQSAAKPATLFVVDCEAHAEILRRLGFASVGGEALVSIGKGDVQKLFGALAAGHCWRYHLVLLDFNFGSLEPGPPRIAAILHRLADFATLYDVDLAERFALYRPSPQDIVQLKRAMRFSDSYPIARLFAKWGEIAQPLQPASILASAVPAEANLATARSALHAAIYSSDLSSRRRLIEDALKVYRSLVSERITTKFYHGAESAEDPFEQIFLTAAADFTNTFLENEAYVKAAEAVLAGDAVSTATEFNASALDVRVRSLAEIRKIHKSCADIRRGR